MLELKDTEETFPFWAQLRTYFMKKYREVAS